MNLTIEHLILLVVLINMYTGFIRDERETGSNSNYIWSAIMAGLVVLLWIFLKEK